MATVFPLIVGMANILLYGAAFTLALGAALVWTLHRSASHARRATTPVAVETPRPQVVRAQSFRTWSGRK